MSGKPALVRSRDVKAVILAAKKAGGTRVEVPIGGTSVIVHFDKNQKPDEATPDPDDSNNSFDKIMRKPEKA